MARSSCSLSSGAQAYGDEVPTEQDALPVSESSDRPEDGPDMDANQNRCDSLASGLARSRN